MSNSSCQLCGKTFDSIELLRRHYIACKNKHCTSCSVCFESSGRMSKCSVCGVTVHPNCLGLKCMKPNTFKCEPCNQLKDPSTIKCELCPNHGGIFIQILDSKNKWVHISCCLWLPNIIMSLSNNKLYANICNLQSNNCNNNKHKCINCDKYNGKQLFCLICGIHCHVTCCAGSNFLLTMVALQEYVLWDNKRVILWLKKLKFSNNIISIFNKYNINGLSLGEINSNISILGLDKFNINCNDIIKLRNEIKKLQIISELPNNFIGNEQYQTLRCVWSVCSKHRNIEFSQLLFIKLWRKYFNKRVDNILLSDDSEHSNYDEPKCMGCGETTDEEHFLLCDNDYENMNKHGAHLYCLDPPLKNIPKMDWFCPKCNHTKYVTKRCIYCSSKMYDLNKKNIIKCGINKCKNISHLQCINKINNNLYSHHKNNKWKCPQCLNKKIIKLIRKNNKLLMKNTLNISSHNNNTNKSYINWNLFEIVEPNEECSIGLHCKKYNENKKHYHCKDINCLTKGLRWCSERINQVEIHQQKHIKKKKLKRKSQFIESDSDNDNDNDTDIQNEKIPKFKPQMHTTNNNSMVDGLISKYLSIIENDSNTLVSMKKRSSAICKYILDRTKEISKQIITIWFKQHKGDEKISHWLQKAMVKLMNPRSEHKTIKDAERLIIDIFNVITKAKILKIDWMPRMKLLDIITSIINNSRLNINVITTAKECKSLFNLYKIPKSLHKLAKVTSNTSISSINSIGTTASIRRSISGGIGYVNPKRDVFDPEFEENFSAEERDNNSVSGRFSEVEHEENICIKMKDFDNVSQDIDWHEIIYGRYGSIKTEHEEKYVVSVVLKDINNNQLKPGFDIGKYKKIFVYIRGCNKIGIYDCMNSYKKIIDKVKETSRDMRERERERDRNRERDSNKNRHRNRRERRVSDRDRDRKKRERDRNRRDRDRSRDRHRSRDNNRRGYRHRDRDRDKSKHRDRDRRRDKSKSKDSPSSHKGGSDKMESNIASVGDPRKKHKDKDKDNDIDKEIVWLRVQSTNNFGEIEYYFWNRVTNETSWNQPKYWKDYEIENNNAAAAGDMGEGNNIIESLETVISSADQHLQTINNIMDNNDSSNDDATRQLLKMTHDFNKEIDDMEMAGNELGHQLNVATDYLNTLKKQQNGVNANKKDGEINLYDSLDLNSGKKKRMKKKRDSSSDSGGGTGDGYGGRKRDKHNRDRNRNRNRDRDRDRSRDRANRDKSGRNNNNDRGYYNVHKDRSRRNHRKYDRR